MNWLTLLKSDYPAMSVNADLTCAVCGDGRLCREAAEVTILDIAECWEGDQEDVAAWVHIHGIHLAGKSVTELQGQFLAYRESVARTQRYLLAPVAAG